LSLLDEQFLVFRFVYPLCGPFQYSFHGYGVLDARKSKRCGRRPLIGGFCFLYANHKLFPDGKASGR
jgi:hypothetical protein